MTSEEFEKLLSEPAPKGSKKELFVQDAMERNSWLIPTPGLLNHHLNFKCVISQFALDNTLVADFAYITKSSILWRVFLVELESPDKPIFQDRKDQIGFCSKFNDALAQIRSWKVFVENNRDAVLSKLEPLWRPAHMQSNPVEFCYVLVYGRSHEYEGRPKRSQSLARLVRDESLHFFSYDSLLRAVENGWNYEKNVMRMNKGILSFKHLHCEPNNLFAFVTHDELNLSKDDKIKLENWGYCIDAWEDDRLLSLNGKSPIGTPEEEVEEILKSLRFKHEKDA